MSEFRLYFRYMRINYLAGLQYKGWVLQMCVVVLHVATDPLEALLMLDRFGSVGDFSASRIMLMYGMALMSFGLAELFARGFDSFPWQVRSGAYDRILLRPRSTGIQVLGMRFHLHRLARVAGGAVLLGLALRAQGPAMTVSNGLMLLFAVVGGALTCSGVFVISGAVVFYTLQPLDYIYIFTNFSYQIAKCPPKYLPGWLHALFMYVMPLMFYCYYPAAVICGWGEPTFMGWLALPTSMLFLGVAMLAWNIGSRHYASSGS